MVASRIHGNRPSCKAAIFSIPFTRTPHAGTALLQTVYFTISSLILVTISFSERIFFVYSRYLPFTTKAGTP